MEMPALSEPANPILRTEIQKVAQPKARAAAHGDITITA